MHLSHAGNLRIESDEQAVDTLKRKGWIEAPQPEFDAATHTCDWVDGAWSVSAIPTQVPQEVPLWAFRSMLALSGLTDAAEAQIAALPEPEKTVALTQWEYGNFIRRDHPLITQMGVQLGLTSEQIDAIFVQANSLT